MTFLPDRSPGPLVEDVLDRITDRTYQHLRPQYVVLQGGDEATHYLTIPVDGTFREGTLFMERGPHSYVISRIKLDLGVKILQRRYHWDRGAGLLFALAVENCLDNNIHLALKKESEDHVVLKDLAVPDRVAEAGKPLENETIFKVHGRWYFPYGEAVEAMKKPSRT